MTLDTTQFNNPPAKFRGAPFWALNHDLTDQDRLREHIDAFKDMGMGGYHLHVRPGLKNQYLGKEYMDAIRACRNHGKANGLLSYLYDEDTWPSGFAGGLVTKDLTNRQRWILFTQSKRNDSPHCQHLQSYHIKLNNEGLLTNWHPVPSDQINPGDWHVYRIIAEDNDRYNGAAYLDVMNPSAVRCFIDSTYEPMLACFGGTFPEDVPAIFTDEPQYAFSQQLPTPHGGEAKLPYTDDLPQTFEEAYGVPFWEIFPTILWRESTGPSQNRWRFWDHCAERYAQAYSDQIGAWCEKHNIDFTGHVNGEDSLEAQIQNTGEAMRHYRSYSIPGIDVLCDYYHLDTAKQAVSMARQDGRKGVMSELYGVTNWDFDFKGHKRQGDWQAALGITFRVPHLSWLSMEGQSKRDYPAAIGIQSPWYKEYKLIEDHFSRINVALTQGKAVVRIGVIHGIESAWLHRGVQSQDQHDFLNNHAAFTDCNHWLLDGHLDFDLICESELPQQHEASTDGKLHVGVMAYDVIVLPNLDTIRSTTVSALESHLKHGGKVVVTGTLPAYIDGKLSTLAQDKLKDATLISHNANSLTQALEPWREVKVVRTGDARCNPINYQLRQVGEERVLFCSQREINSVKARPFGTVPNPEANICLEGLWQVEELNTFTGEPERCAYTQHGNQTIIPWIIHDQSHRLLRLTPGAGSTKKPQKQWQVISNAPEPHRVTREEPNVLLLDKAEYKVNDEPWQPAMDTTMAQRKLAERFGWPDWVQPYSVKDPGSVQHVTRRYTLTAKTDLPATQLMCERLASAEITLNSQPLDTTIKGHWVDRDLPVCDFPPLTQGSHSLEITLPLDGVDRHLEWVYLLGEFDVETRGAHTFISSTDNSTNPVFWGDVCHQGMPFYGGNLSYEFTLQIDSPGAYAIRLPNIGGSLVRVWCDAEDKGPVAFDPYRAELGHLEAGEHHIRICCYGNRHNSFGALHNQAHGWNWYGPPAWRVENEHQNDIWQLKPTGITRAPLLEKLIT